MCYLASYINIDQKSKSNEYYSCYIGYLVSAPCRNWKGLWFIPYCSVVNFLRLGTRRNRRFGYLEQSELMTRSLVGRATANRG